MASYADLTVTRTTQPDLVALNATVKTMTSDATAVVTKLTDTVWRGKKANLWTPAEITAVQSAIDAATVLTPQLAAQRAIDSFPIEYKALVLALIDALNVIRAARRSRRLRPRKPSRVSDRRPVPCDATAPSA